MTISEIAAVLEHFAPLALQEEYDNSGLLLGSPDADISGVLITLDITEEVLDEALANDCNLVIAHHPLIFKGLKRLVGADPVQRLTVKAIRNNIAVYAMHTNLDNSVHGLNAHICNLLGINNINILVPGKGLLLKLVTFCPVDHADRVRQALFDAGAGHIGNYDYCSYNVIGQGTFRASANTNPFLGRKNELHIEAETRIEVILPNYHKTNVVTALLNTHPYEEVAYDIYPLVNTAGFAGSGITGMLDPPVQEIKFLEEVKLKLGIPFLRHSETDDRRISKVAICTGSGSFLIPEAINSGAQAFLTADIKYHDFFDTDKRLLLVDIGHYESETFVKDLIYGILNEKFPNFAFLISKINTNPVHYY